MTKPSNSNQKIVSVGEIKPNPNNPRVIRDDKFRRLVDSIRSFPKMMHIRPIVVNSDMIVLGGNMRLRACQEVGLKEIPVIIANDLSDAEQREFIIKDNSSIGEWDFDLLANEWNVKELNDWGLSFPDLEETMPITKSDEDPNENLPSASHDDYSIFELVMLHQNKLKLFEVLNDVRQKQSIDKIEDALMYIINHYQL